MSHRIYYADAYTASFDAVVTRAFDLDGRPAVTLDRTAFYPTSGGQPFDVGTLGPAKVVDVIDQEDGSVAHVLDVPLEGGARVAGAIDWDRRFDHMQQHTGQHVLSAAFDRVHGNRTVSFHMGAQVSTIDLAEEASPEAIAVAEREANRIVWEDRPVSIRFVSAEEAASLPFRKEPARTGTLRVIDVADFDLSACGGTHVSRTGAIGIIAVSAWERFRGGTRLTFVCGGRTLRMFGSYRDAVAASTRALSVLPSDLPGAIERLQGEAKDLRRTAKTMQETLARHEAARLVAEAPEVRGVRCVVRAIDGWDAAGLKAMAAAATSDSRVIAALLSSRTPAVVVVARSGDVRGADAHVLLNQLFERFGGKGGGKPAMAQGGGLEGDIADIEAAARSAIEAMLDRD